jgi:nucleoside-diphosphate-sugar epimerase
LVGSHVVARLLSDGWTVRALARRPDRAIASLPAGLDLRAGDVLDESSFTRAATGCHVVFHAAANIIVRGGWDSYRVTNIEGTRNAIAAAGRAGARLLHVSSVAVYGPEGRYRSARTDEETPLTPLPDRAFYARSKRESELMVLAAHREGRVWAAAVRPDVIYGKGDRQFVPRMGKLILRGAVPLIDGGRSILAVVHAENVAAGIVLAATSDVAGGKAYNLANDFDVSVRRFIELAGAGLGRRPLFVPMPLWAARGAMRAVRWTSRVLTGGRVNLVNNASIDFITRDNPYTSERAKRELGWSPAVRPETGIPAAFGWWLETQRARR